MRLSGKEPVKDFSSLCLHDCKLSITMKFCASQFICSVHLTMIYFSYVWIEFFFSVFLHKCLYFLNILFVHKSFFIRAYTHRPLVMLFAKQFDAVSFHTFYWWFFRFDMHVYQWGLNFSIIELGLVFVTWLRFIILG